MQLGHLSAERRIDFLPASLTREFRFDSRRNHANGVLSRFLSVTQFGNVMLARAAGFLRIEHRADQQTACPAGTTSNTSGATSCFSIVPSAPGIGAAIAGNAQAQIPFTVPMQNGGSPILDYTVTCIGPNTVMATGTVSPLVVSPLTNMQLYSCSITARNANGSGTASATTNVTPQSGALLALSSVVSRKFHTSVGLLDIPVDRNPIIGGPVSVEPRFIGSGHTIVFQFNNTVTGAGMVTTTSGNATATSTGTNEVLVTLTNVPDNSRATVTLTNVPSANGSAGGSVSIGFLVGDVSNSRSVNASDIAAIKAHLNQIPNTATARFDLNASGTVNATDVSAAKARAGIVLP